ncbi:TonB-dependent receptor [Spongiivirga citrea]|uniref:TonB-dependent receptor n=1 Tax=Spongiivirga citrea TaxID=1481457 RepID=A0A6M0CGW9_9FLAO|nr:TonB-dependent receptor [Spongiivirga citrea]NER17168.1 TonB-dependent receptor [Spongiivirga citrea]
MKFLISFSPNFPEQSRLFLIAMKAHIFRVALVLIFLSSFSASAQQITVKDQVEDEILIGVAIYNPDASKSTITNENGQADLSQFDLGEEIIFEHIGFIKKTITKARYFRNGFIVYLSPEAERLNEVVLSASKTGEAKTRVAEKIAVLSSQTIQRSAPQTSADILTEAPGVRIQKSQGGGGSPVIRGFEANRVLLVVDGVRLNNAIFRSGHLQNAITISPNGLERTEVIFGPSSVIYGSDALGGVVHYYTKTPQINDTKRFSGGFLSRYSQATDETTNSLDMQFSFGRWASFTNISYSSFGDIRMGRNRKHGFDDWGLVNLYSNNTEEFYNPDPVVNSNPNEQKGTSYDQFDLLQKFSVKLNDKTSFGLNIQFSESSNVPRFDRLAEYRDGTLRFARWDYGPQKRFLVSPQLQINPKRKWMSKGTITAAFQSIEESRIERSFGSITRESQIEDVEVYSLNADFFADLRAKRNLSYGLEFTYNDVQSTAFSEDLVLQGNRIVGLEERQAIPTRYPSDGSSYSTAAAYANYRQDINKNSTFNSGIRYTFTKLKAAWNEQALVDSNLDEVMTSNNSVTATLGYVFRPTKNWQLNAVLSSGFRSPNIDDIGKIREQGGTLTIPNPYLEPEFAYNGEIGITKYLGRKSNAISFTTYYTWLRSVIGRDDFVVEGDTTTADANTILFNGEEVETLANTNLGNAYIVGGTFDVNTQIVKNLRFKSNLTYTAGRIFDGDRSLPSILPFFGSATLSYDKNKIDSQLYFRFSGSKNPEDFSEGGEDGLEETPLINPNATEDVDRYAGLPSWNTLGAAIAYNFSSSLRLQLSMDNIFDRHYREFASGISAPGRNFRVMASVNF